MGFRTVITLINDVAHEWSKDPQLGAKIMKAATQTSTAGEIGRDSGTGYGYVVECVHADNQSLVVLDSYIGKTLASTSWWQSKTDAQRDEELLKLLAERLGYDLHKKSK